MTTTPDPDLLRDAFRRYLRAFNEGDLDAFDTLIAPHYVNHSPGPGAPPPPPGPEGLKPVVTCMREQWPDLEFEEVELLVDGRTLIGHVLVHGTADEPVRQIQIERFEGAQIVEHWRATGG